jgi:hypothetical protein
MIRSSNRSRNARTRQKKQPHGQRRFTPFLERLEDRTAPAVIRVNAGGPVLTGTPNWEADTMSAPSAFSNFAAAGSNTYSVTNSIDLTHPSVPAGTPMALFQTERWDPASGAEMQWDFPVTPGTYQVRLFFAEIFDGALSVGARVFDVSIEGTLVLDNYDVFAEVGGYKGVVKTFQVNSNATLDIDFARVVENPAIKGIEIVSVAAQPNQLGVSPSGVNFGAVTSGTTANQTVTLSNLGAAGDPSIVVQSTTISGTHASQFSDSFNDAAGVTLAPGASANFTVSFSPTDSGARSANLTINHSGANTPIIVGLTGTAQTTTIPVGFGKSTLPGTGLTNPTTLQFGPDGKLYVGEQDGLIKIYTVIRNGPNSYSLTATQTITSIQSIANHDDNGALNPSITTRLVTGLLVAGTAANPVIYVTSSDPRIGAGPGGADLNLDTNSGILSRLTWNGSSWVKLDLVRGLPRSEENHAPNGMALDTATNTLYIAQGGNTNMGATSTNFALLPEFALSAAILSVNLTAIGNTTYDLPTLDDENRPGVNDANDPFGGNDGKNQAKLVPGGPVQVHASGFRNPYDVILTQAGRMYSIDNGSNAGWGDVPLDQNGNPTTAITAGNATNAVHEPGKSDQDNLHFITGPGFYAGHPNPTRANLANTFNPTNPQSPVSVANSIEGFYLNTGVQDGALALFDGSTNGMVEYTASNFGGALKGDLLAAGFSNQIFRVKLNSAGSVVTLQEVLFNSVGIIPLDVTALGDTGPFPGTIWVADHQSNSIFVFEPNDFSGAPICFGHDDPALDEDGDGYNNHDEIVNGTNPCSAGDFPPDWDQDRTSNLLDPDDDNDGRPDTSDPFAIDKLNGKGTQLPVLYTWENNAPSPGGLLNLGFTGLMSNGTANYASLFDPAKMTAGGAAGVVTVDAVSEGDATGATNTQEYAFQFGVDIPPGSGPFTARTRIVGPFAGLTPQAGQSMGLFIGTGDQDNYFKIIVSGSGGGGVQWVKEVAGVVTTGTLSSVSLPGPSGIDLYLTVNPNAATVQARYTVTVGGVTGPFVNLGAPVAIPSSWWTQSTGLAVGIISSSAGAAPPFPATWDFIEVAPETVQVLLVTPGSLDFGSVAGGGTATRTVTLKNLGAAGDPAIVVNSTTISGANAAQFSDTFNDAAGVTLAPGASATFNVIFTPSGTGSRSATLSITHSGANATLTVPLTAQAQQASDADVLIVVTPNQDINASTFNGGSFQINNNSTGNTKITNVRFDLSTALLPDVVFDPDGTAGDPVGKTFTVDAASAVGLTGHAFSGAHDGGFDVLDIQFSDFGPVELFFFSVDIDPTSIKGASAPGPNDSGSVSGLELTGATVTITFDDGSVQTVRLFRQPGSLSGSQNTVKTGSPPQPGLQLLGAVTPVTLAAANQTVRITGPVGATAVLMQVEAGLFVAGVPNGGFDLDPFEANSVIAITEQTVTIGAAGFVDVPITLTKSQTDTGLNHIVAVIKDASGRTGPTSPVLVVKLEPASTPPATNQPPQVNAGPDLVVTLPNSANLQGTVSDDGLPVGGTLTSTWSQVSGPGTVSFGDAAAPATTASFSLAGTYVLQLTANDGQLTVADQVTVTVNPEGALSQVVSFTLINADSDQPIPGFDPLPSGATLNLATLPTRNLNIRANVSGAVGSVVFTLDGSPFRTESSAPYALAGDASGDYFAWTPNLGGRTLTGSPFSGPGGSGTPGSALTISFNVIDSTANQPPLVSAGPDLVVSLPNPANLQGTVSDDGLPVGGTLTSTWTKVSGPGTVTFANASAALTSASFSLAGTYVLQLTANDSELSAFDQVTVTVNPAGASPEVVSFTLINADTDLPIPGFDPLPSGATLNLATLPTRNLNIRANLSASVGSVVFTLDGSPFRTENTAPYALAGDTGGDYFAWTPVVGGHTLTATPFSNGGGGGTPGVALTISFTVTDAPAGAASEPDALIAMRQHAGGSSSDEQSTPAPSEAAADPLVEALDVWFAALGQQEETTPPAWLEEADDPEAMVADLITRCLAGNLGGNTEKAPS